MDIYEKGILSIFLICGIVIITPLFLFCILALILENRECDRLQQQKDLIPDFEQQFQAESKKKLLYQILVCISGIALLVMTVAFLVVTKSDRSILMNIDTKEILSHFLGWCMIGSIVILITIIISYRLTCQNYDELQQQKPDISTSSAVQNQNQYQLRLMEKQKQTLKKSSFIFGTIALLMIILFLILRTIFIAQNIPKTAIFRNILFMP